MTQHPMVREILNHAEGKPSPSFAFVAESGGMKWVTIGGMLAAFKHLGVAPNVMVGTSGGGMALLYYAAGHTADDSICVLNHLGEKGYDLKGGKRFLDYQRLLQSKPVMDLHGLVYDAFTKRTPLHWENLSASQIPFYMTATTYGGEEKLLPLFGKPIEIIQENIIHASRIPFVAHPAHDETVLWDGVLTNALPIQQAFELGVDRVIALRTQKSTATKQDGFFVRQVLIPLMKKQSPHLGELYLKRKETAQAKLAPFQNHPHVLMVEPTEMLVGSLTTNKQRLWQQVAVGWRSVFQTLGLEIPPYPTSWEV